jgi:hypothetical protein
LKKERTGGEGKKMPEFVVTNPVGAADKVRECPSSVGHGGRAIRY